jgi:hypothetical protein
MVGNYMIFEHDRRLSDVRGAMKRAVKEFLKTKEGKKAIRDNNGFFNWGDATIHVPDSFWREQGLRLIPATQRIIVLDHDENLMR